MKKVLLYRFSESDQGTLGYWLTNGFEAKSIELPWRDNKQNLSCIPEGIYTCVYRWSKKFKSHYHITNVKGRSWILTHSANLAGDVTKGYKTQLHGCVAIGKYHGKLNGQDAVLCSRLTLKRFILFVNKQPFELEIRS